MPIKIFATGGTFDKEYNELTGELMFQKTHVPQMLGYGRSLLHTQVETLMMVDSLDMTEEQRTFLAEKCRNANESHILITHGTDSMPETAKVLAEQVKDKTIVLTGAMIPYKFVSSDGLFNLGSALAFVQSLPHGVYIAMNGQYFTWDNVQKNKALGLFEKREEP